MKREIQIQPAVLPLAGAVFALCIGCLVGQYIALFYKGWDFPIWLYPLLLIFALESMYFSAYVLSPRTPFTWRLIELGMLAVFIAFHLRLEKGSWQSFAQVDFALPFGLAFFVWAYSGGFGQQLARMAKVRDELGDQAVSTLSWEYDSLAMKEPNTSLPIEYFLFRLCGSGFLAAALAVAARRTGAWQSLSQAEQLPFAVLHLLALVSGLVLLGSAYLYRLITIWQHIKVVYPAELLGSWLKNLVVVCVGIALIAASMPVDFSPITFDDLAHGLTSLLVRITSGPPPMEHREAVGQEERPSPQIPWGELEYAEPSLWASIAAFIYMLLIVGLLGLAIIVFVGFLVASLVQGELERLGGLPRAAARFYMVVKRAAKQLLSSILRSLQRAQAVRTGKPTAAFPQGSASPAHLRDCKPESGAVRDIRSAFRRLIAAAAAAGLPLGQGETPAEFGRRIGQALPEHKGEVLDFIESYHLARYSSRKIHNTLRERALTQARRIAGALYGRAGRKEHD